MTKSKNILVAPLNWGLGHATRCIPIIDKLQENGFTPVIASDGASLALLKKEFPTLKHIELPSYQIKYAKNGKYFKLKLLFNLPKLIKAVGEEKKIIKKIINENNIKGIISDNRFGIYHRSTPSVYITHQLNVLSGSTTTLSSMLHQSLIRNFDECWVPDFKGSGNFSGRLGHVKNLNINLKYIGLLSRFNKSSTPIIYDYLLLLSGPEPQRSLLEKKLLREFKDTSKKILLIKGKIEQKQKITTEGNITIYNFMTSTELEIVINQSNVVIARSGYTTIMDLAKLNKKAFFIPTPGQFEQMYLAKRLEDLNYVPYEAQEDFCLKRLEDLKLYQGLNSSDTPVNYTELFSIFN